MEVTVLPDAQPASASAATARAATRIERPRSAGGLRADRRVTMERRLRGRQPPGRDRDPVVDRAERQRRPELRPWSFEYQVRDEDTPLAALAPRDPRPLSSGAARTCAAERPRAQHLHLYLRRDIDRDPRPARVRAAPSLNLVAAARLKQEAPYRSREPSRSIPPRAGARPRCPSSAHPCAHRPFGDAEQPHRGAHGGTCSPTGSANRWGHQVERQVQHLRHLVAAAPRDRARGELEVDPRARRALPCCSTLPPSGPSLPDAQPPGEDRRGHLEEAPVVIRRFDVIRDPAPSARYEISAEPGHASCTASMQPPELEECVVRTR